MKKWIALLLAAVLCLSLSACGEKTSPEEEMLMTPATIDPPAKIETKPVNETIEITMDNWQDYFEEYDEDVWELDAFQELDKLTNCAYLVLKDEYASRLVEEKALSPLRSNVSWTNITSRPTWKTERGKESSSRRTRPAAPSRRREIAIRSPGSKGGMPTVPMYITEPS